jgi:gliding motility-associated-like protein
MVPINLIHVRTLKALLLLVPALLWHGLIKAQGQQYSIASGSVTACSGVIEDTGGPSSEYSDNESHVLTICPDVPGNVIYLTWFVFDLSTAGNPDDYIAIYDGDNTGATSLGVYTGQDLQNIIVSGTVFNTTGCLTLEWWSNGTGIGNFSAGFQCTTPCSNPTAVASMSEPVPLLACVGEVISFDGSASYAVQNFNLQQWAWNFDDGTIDSTSGPVTTHSFDDDGEYMVQLTVTDDNGCQNLNLVDLQVLVSTTPNFSVTSESVETCFGATVNLIGNGQPVTWTGLPDAGIGQPTLLPDDVGSPYQSGLTYEQFSPGQTLNNVNDLLSVCVEMEHSFMGDLVLQVICPNGQTTILHQQGGGGTFIGDANDADFFDPEPGTCWTYCWSPNATNGTFSENSSSSTVPSSQGTALAPGTYEAVQSFNNLLGCPLNGEWIFQSTDLWAADNGFICNWTINWNPAIIPDVTTFTPTIGTGADSSLWAGGTAPDYISADGDTVQFTATAPGVYPFVYSVTDNFGCTYDTTITVTVNEPFSVNAGNDQVVCNDPVQLSAFIVNSQGYPLTWSWSPSAGLSNPNIPNPTSLVTSTTTYTVTAYVTGEPACTSSEEVTVSIDPGLDPGTDSLVVVCATPPTFNLIDMLGGTPGAGGVWTDGNGTVIPDTFDPVTDPAGIYTYTVTTALGCVGTADLEIQILGADDPSCCGVVDAGPDETVCVLSYTLSASVGNTGAGNWTGPAGYVFGNANSPTTQVTAPDSGPATFYWIEDDGVLCYLIDSVTITFTRPLSIELTLTDAICHDSCDGTATVAMTGGNGAFTYAWSNGGPDAPDADGLCFGIYTLNVTDENGCTDDAQFSILQPDPLQIDAVSQVEPWCHGGCDGSITITDADAVLYSFDGGVSFVPGATRTGVCAGIYDLVIQSAPGCQASTTFTVTEPPEVVAAFNHVPVPANIDAPTVSFYNLSANATAYIWDIAGLTTTTEPQPQFTFSNKYPGTYPVCLVAIDAHGCTDTICHDVVIDDVLATYVPNAFSPDGDGINDQWWMTSNIPDIANFQLLVFDRWGQVVFETQDPAIRWNGTYRNGGGEVMKQDLYAYRITYQIISTGGSRELMGHVTLLK